MECGGEGTIYAPGYGDRVCWCCGGTGEPCEDEEYSDIDGLDVFEEVA
jgi:hypothetical protein